MFNRIWDQYRRSLFIATGLVGLGIQFLWIYKIWNHFGWDFRMYRATSLAFSAGEDPYILENLIKHGADLTFAYYPLFLPLLKPFSIATEGSYLIAQILMLSALWFFASKMVKDKAGAFLWIATGFWAAGCNFSSGNIALVESVILALCLLWVYEGRHKISALSLGAMSSLKLFPIMYLGIFPFFLRKGFRLFAVGFLAFVLPALFSFVFMKDLSFSWLEYNLGHRKSQLSPIDELIVTSDSPSFFNILFTFARECFGEGRLAKAVLGVLYLALVAVSLYLFVRFKRAIEKAEMGSSKKLAFIFAFGILLVGILMPRFKPYSFSHLLVPMAILTDSFSAKSKWVLAVLVFLVTPLGLWTNAWIKAEWGAHFAWYAVNGTQTYALLIAIYFIYRFFVSEKSIKA